MGSFVGRAAAPLTRWQGCDLAPLVSGLAVNIKVIGRTVNGTGRVCMCVCVCSQGVGVNWCYVLKVVNEAAEHPRSGRETHKSTRR